MSTNSLMNIINEYLLPYKWESLARNNLL